MLNKRKNREREKNKPMKVWTEVKTKNQFVSLNNNEENMENKEEHHRVKGKEVVEQTTKEWVEGVFHDKRKEQPTGSSPGVKTDDRNEVIDIDGDKAMEGEKKDDQGRKEFDGSIKGNFVN